MYIFVCVRKNLLAMVWPSAVQIRHNAILEIIAVCMQRARRTIGARKFQFLVIVWGKSIFPFDIYFYWLETNEMYGFVCS